MCAAVSAGSRHWFGVLVKTWIAVAPMAAPRAGAAATPPCVETCAPNASVIPLGEREARDQGDEPHTAPAALGYPVRGALVDDELLHGEVTDRNHQASAGGELLEQGRGDGGRGGGHEDAVERRGLRPSRGPVAQPRFDVREAQPPEPLLGFHQEVGVPL